MANPVYAEYARVLQETAHENAPEGSVLDVFNTYISDIFSEASLGRDECPFYSNDLSKADNEIVKQMLSRSGFTIANGYITWPKK